MNAKLTEARRVLSGLQQGYAQSLRKVDQLLRSAVAQDPSCVDEARAVQGSYGTLTFEPVGLAPLEQPAAQHNDPQVAPPAAEQVEQPAGGKVRKNRLAPVEAAASASTEQPG